jgi:hypothetical protein
MPGNRPARLIPSSTKITEVDNRVRENAERIDATDKRAQQGICRMLLGQGRCATADAKPRPPKQLRHCTNSRNHCCTADATTANQGVAAANTRISTIDTRLNNIDKYTHGPAQSVMFKVNSVVRDDASSRPSMALPPGREPALGYLVEIQGFASADGERIITSGLAKGVRKRCNDTSSGRMFRCTVSRSWDLAMTSPSATTRLARPRTEPSRRGPCPEAN